MKNNLMDFTSSYTFIYSIAANSPLALNFFIATEFLNSVFQSIDDLS